MKKIILLIFGLIIVGCAMPSEIEKTVCIKTIQEPIKTDRSITLIHKNNLITSIESVEKLYFSEEFTKEMFENLIDEMQERHLNSENIVFEEEFENDFATITISLNNIEEATASELALIGIEVDDPEFVPGIIETVRFNEKDGYTCEIVEE